MSSEDGVAWRCVSNPHHPMKLSPTFSSRAALCAVSLLLLGAARLPAQTAAKPASGDDTIKLSEFSVTADKASGYRAQSAITATGFGANVLDVPVTSMFSPASSCPTSVLPYRARCCGSYRA